MATKAFTKQELESLAMIGLPKSYQRVRQIPLDPTEIFASFEDAQTYASGASEQFGDIAYVGQVLSVVNATADTVTVYKIGFGGVLEEIGSVQHTSLNAQDYTEARTLATNENIGQIINVANEEEDSGGTIYSAGLYIVTGSGEVAKLGTTSASGDVEGDVENLKGRVGTLETNMLAVSGALESLYWLTDEDLVIE